MAKRAPESDTELAVSEYEGAVLSLIARMQPVTRYGLLKAFERSPTTSYVASKGTLYPLITRMIARDFVTGETGTSGQKAEELGLTDAGQRALTQWITQTGPEHSFGHDPLSDRIMSLGDLSHEERVRWIAEAKALLLEKKQQLREYGSTLEGPYADIVHGSALAMIDAKLEWLDRLLIKVTRDEKLGSTG